MRISDIVLPFIYKSLLYPTGFTVTLIIIKIKIKIIINNLIIAYPSTSFSGLSFTRKRAYTGLVNEQWNLIREFINNLPVI